MNSSLVRSSFRKRGHDFPPLLVKLKSRLLSKGDGSGEVSALFVADAVPDPFPSPVRVGSGSSSVAVASALVSSSSSLPLSLSLLSCRLCSSGASSGTHTHSPPTNTGTELSTSSVVGRASSAVFGAAHTGCGKIGARRRRSSGQALLF